MATRLRGAAVLRLDARKVVEFFGGADALSEALKQHDILRITPYAVAQWVRRKQIPYARRFELELLAKKQKRRFKLDNFYKPAPKGAKAKEATPCPSETAAS